MFVQCAQSTENMQRLGQLGQLEPIGTHPHDGGKKCQKPNLETNYEQIVKMFIAMKNFRHGAIGCYLSIMLPNCVLSVSDIHICFTFLWCVQQFIYLAMCTISGISKHNDDYNKNRQLNVEYCEWNIKDQR